MAKGKAALDALEALLSGAKRVDIGDMTRPVTAARRKALEAMLPKADDWGWKGGKPGEIIKTQAFYYPRGAGKKQVLDQARMWIEAAKKNKLGRSMRSAVEYYGDDPKTWIDPNLDAFDYTVGLADEFGKMASADIPREWTGKVFRAVDPFEGELDYSELSQLMRPMTNDQRETFLSLLPEWSGTLDELADAARNL